MKRSSFVCITIITTTISWLLPLLLGKYSDLTFPSIETENIPKELVSISELSNQVRQEERDLNDSKQKRPLCSTHPELLKGFQSPSTAELKATERENWAADLARDLRVKNGFWQPTQCEALYAVSVIVCVRDRAEQLRRFLLHMHPFLSRQMLRYRIVVVEQNNTLSFNRAKLLNIGFKEAVKASKGGPEGFCVVFQDVDLLPLNDFNTYACTKSPRHMSVAVDSLRFELPYRTLCGGALALTAQQFRSVNGFSNEYKGWGGEDDDFCARLQEKGLSVVRFNAAVSVYHMMQHAPAVAAPDRFLKMNDPLRGQHSDGLSSLSYTVQLVVRHPLMLHLVVTW